MLSFPFLSNVVRVKKPLDKMLQTTQQTAEEVIMECTDCTTLETVLCPSCEE